MFFKVVKRVKKSKFRSKHVAHTVNFILQFLKNESVFRLSHIKDWVRCYKKYRANRCSGNIGIMTSQQLNWQKFARHFWGCLRRIFKLEHDMSTADYCRSFFMNQHNIWRKWYLPIRAFRKQGIRIKYYNYPKDSSLYYRILFTPFLKQKERTIRIHVQGVHRGHKCVRHLLEH